MSLLPASLELQNSTEVFDGVVRRYSKALVCFFRRRLPASNSDSEDLAQEVFVRLARCGSIGAIQNVEGYLFQTAANVLIDHSRRCNVRQTGRHVEYEDEGHSIEGISFDRVLIGRQDIEKVIAAIEMLPERVRGAFLLHRLEGMSYPEIAARLGVSVSSVEKYIMRALRHITEMMRDDA